MGVGGGRVFGTFSLGGADVGCVRRRSREGAAARQLKIGERGEEEEGGGGRKGGSAVHVLVVFFPCIGVFYLWGASCFESLSGGWMDG